MTIRMTSLGLPAALLAASLFGACQNTARGLEQDTENNAAKAKPVLQDAAAAAERAAQEAKQMAANAADATKEAASDAAEKAKTASAEAEQKSKNSANTTASALDATAETMRIKTALIADKSVDASDINVDTNGSTMTVTLKGHVPTAAQKAAAERIARDKAPDYKIVNMLLVAKG
jgi:predicted small secreted protein